MAPAGPRLRPGAAAACAEQRTVSRALTGSLHHPARDKVFLGVDREVGATQTAPVKVADVARNGRPGLADPNAHAKAESVAGAGQVGRASLQAGLEDACRSQVV